MNHPVLAEKLLSTRTSSEILASPVLDFRAIGTSDLNTWHWLFDPTAILATQINSTGLQGLGSARVISVYSYGECSLRQICPSLNDHSIQVNIDNSLVTIRPTTTLPSAQIQVAGYSTIEQLANAQILSVDLLQTPVKTSDQFPLQVLVIFGGMMGAIAIFVLAKARN